MEQDSAVQDVPTTDDLPGSPRVSQAEIRQDPDEVRREASIEAYARDHEGLTTENEVDALDHLLGARVARVYDVKVEYETPEGPARMNFVIKGYGGRKIDEIEVRNRKPNGDFDQFTADAELVAAATVKIETGKREVRVTDEEFLMMDIIGPDDQPMKRRVPSPALALEMRFADQLGLLSGVAREIRRVSGYDANRVGEAQRRLVVASGN